MSINFNIVKKPKKSEDEELEEELEEKEEDLDDKPSTGYDPKKKMLRFMAMIVGVMIVILLILFVASSALKTKTKEYSYSDIEKVLVSAAKSYFKDHPDYLPQEEDSIIEVDSSNLVAEGKMNELSTYTKEGVNCTARVQVEMKDDEYFYTPDLNCGDAYSSVPLYTKVLDDNPTVGSGYGLYASGGQFVFRGEKVDNYVKLDKSLWRIVKITSNNNIVLVNEEGVGYSQPWDDRYNDSTQYESGINNYEASRVKEFLDRVYKITDENDYEKFLSNKDRNRIVEFNQCIGKRARANEDKTGATECSQLLRNQKLGLLTLSEYMYASVDPNCKSADTKSCKNYNYLAIKEDWWLATASTEDNTSVFYVGGTGTIKHDNASSYALVRPVIYLKDTVMFKSGNGTLEKPYKVR